MKKNGNITRLRRRGLTDNLHGAFGLVDDLYMTYGGNMLTSVRDVASRIPYAGAMDFDGVTGQEYPLTYNASGSLVSDAGRGIARIDYDRLNNPVRIQFTDGSVTRYVYSTTGEKLRVIHQTAVPNITVAIGSARELLPSEILSADSTDYLLGGSLTLRNGRIDKYQFEEGYCQAAAYSGNTSQDNFTFYYYDRDHLGNIRQVINAIGSTKGPVIQRMNYYPFGAEFCDGSTDSEVQSRKYNGKEFDKMHGLNTYDYGARQYNPVTARWDRMDPLCEKYYSMSPYVYCHNNPINRIDADGEDDYRFDSKTGTFHLMEKTEDKTDRVYGYHYDKKSGQYQKNKGFFSSKVQMSNIEKGILKDGLNLKDNNLLISVGGENEPSVQGVKEFTLALSELVNREISGLGYSADGSGDISDIVIGKYIDNTYTSSICNPMEISKKYKDFTPLNVVLDFHTHPNGNLGATESAPELSKDIRIKRNTKENAPNAIFLILYRPSYEMKEYDYTEK